MSSMTCVTSKDEVNSAALQDDYPGQKSSNGTPRARVILVIQAWTRRTPQATFPERANTLCIPTDQMNLPNPTANQKKKKTSDECRTAAGDSAARNSGAACLGVAIRVTVVCRALMVCHLIFAIANRAKLLRLLKAILIVGQRWRRVYSFKLSARVSQKCRGNVQTDCLQAFGARQGRTATAASFDVPLGGA